VFQPAATMPAFRAQEGADMPRKKAAESPPAPARETASMKAVPEADEVLVGQVLKRPGGYYWSLSDGGREFGPYDSFEEAQADMEAAADLDAPEPGESLQEAESELGIADWIDPETGEPAEGLSRPHLDGD
jgi:pyocin large subunit-like protein